jgi:hypothetical protein
MSRSLVCRRYRFYDTRSYLFRISYDCYSNRCCLSCQEVGVAALEHIKGVVVRADWHHHRLPTNTCVPHREVD